MVVTEARQQNLAANRTVGEVNADIICVSQDQNLTEEARYAQLCRLTNERVGIGSPATYDTYTATEERSIHPQYGDLAELYAGKRILVTGYSGGIGSELIPTLAEEFDVAEIHGLSRGVSEPVRPFKGSLFRHDVDIQDRDTTMREVELIRPDIIFHLAALRLPNLAEKQPHRALLTNIQGTRNVLEAADDAGTEVACVASTGKALNAVSDDFYAASKIIAEAEEALASIETGLNVVATRFTHVGSNSNLMNIVFESIAMGRPIDLHSFASEMYAESVLEAKEALVVAAADQDPDNFNIFAVNYLGYPLNTSEIVAGALWRHGGWPKIKAPIKYVGYPENGYISDYHQFLFDPEADGKSPLLNPPEAAVSWREGGLDVFKYKLNPANFDRDRVDFLMELAANGADTDLLRKVTKEAVYHIWDLRVEAMEDKDRDKAAIAADKRLKRGVGSEDHRRADLALVNASSLASV